MKNYIIPLFAFILLLGCGNNATDKIKNNNEKIQQKKLKRPLHQI